MNDKPDIGGGANATTIAAGKLRKVVERVERLEHDKAAIGADIREVYLEAKGEGFDVKTIRTLVRWRKKDKAKRESESALLELYAGALGETGVFG